MNKMIANCKGYTILKNRKFVLLRVLDLIFSRKLDHLVKRLVTTFCIRHLE